MRKFCERCGTELSDDDFLCPKCGAIWGDQVYVVPVQMMPERKEHEPEEFPTGEPAQEPEQPQQKKQPRWLLPLAAVVLILGFVLFWLGSDREPWAEDGTTAPVITTQTKLPEPTMTEPSTTQGEYVTYTVQLLDQFGYPVPNVRINYPNTNPFLSTASSFVISDADGIAAFEIRRSEEAYFWISQIPDGYSMQISNPKYAFPEGQTHYQINLIHAGTIPGAYSVTMLDQQWLYAPLADAYRPGVTVQVYILKAVQDVGYMMFVNGAEIKPLPIDTHYLLFTFIMPEKDVTLDLKIIQDRGYEGMIRNYYLQYPDAEDIEVIQYYGHYGIADVVILSAYSPDSVAHQTYVGGYCFRYPSQNGILVLVDGRYHSLSAAYESGFISKTDMESIYRQHTICFWDLYLYEVDPIA